MWSGCPFSQYFPSWFNQSGDISSIDVDTDNSSTRGQNLMDIIPVLCTVVCSDKSFVDKFWSELTQFYNKYLQDLERNNCALVHSTNRLLAIQAVAVLVKLCEFTDEEDSVRSKPCTKADKGKEVQ